MERSEPGRHTTVTTEVGRCIGTVSPRMGKYNPPVDIDLAQLPIPDWGLLCARCTYPLRGLPTHRCPECGTEIDMPALVQPWTRLRGPRFTGGELPLPDFGLACPACARPLAGAQRHECPHCGTPFDPEAWRPAGEWFTVDSTLCGPLPVPGVQALLAAERVPHVDVGEDALRQLWGIQSITVTRLRVATEFYFELLWLLRRARAEFEAARARGAAEEWRCPRCGQRNPGHFEICWKCQAVK